MVRHDLKLDLSETPEGLKGFLSIKQTCLMPLPSLEWRGALLLATVVEQPDIQLSQVAEILDEAENNSKYSKPRVQTSAARN